MLIEIVETIPRLVGKIRGNDMKRAIKAVFVLFILTYSAFAQVDDFCAEAGLMPSLDSPFAHIPYVYGRVILHGYDAVSRTPRVTVTIVEGQQAGERQRLNQSGTFCFRRRGSSSTLVVEVDGVEIARRTLPASSAIQQREDFEIYAPQSQRPGSPAVVSAKFTRPSNPQTTELYKKAADAESAKDKLKALDLLKQIVALDAADFIGWAKLGSLYFAQKNLTEAEAAFRKSLESKIEYTPAWIYMGQIRVEQKQYLAAAAIFEHAVSLDPKSARAYQLLGEAYLQAKQGTLGVAALNAAIRLDPIAMAECHLQIAHLYHLAGAKQLAAREYKLLLEKVPDHPDKKRLEKFIRDNP